MAMHFRASNITTRSAHALLTLVSKLNAELTRLHREVKSKSDKRGLIADSNDASKLANKYDECLTKFLRDLEEMWED